MPPWTAEFAIDLASATSLAQTFEPGATLEPLGEGFDNQVFVSDGGWVYRFPRRTVARRALQQEIALLPTIASRLGERWSVPTPAYVGAPGPAYPSEWVATPRVAGESGERTAGSALAAGRVDELAALLGALHAIPIGAFPPSATPNQPHPRTSMAGRERLVRDVLARLRSASDAALADPTFSADSALVADAFDTLAAERGADPALGADAAAERWRLVHGDLHARHLRVEVAPSGDGTPRARLVGLIDWGDVAFGDPAIDFVIGVSWLPRTAWAEFRRRLRIDDATWWRARWIALSVHAAIVEYGVDVGDETFARYARAVLRRLAAG